MDLDILTFLSTLVLLGITGWYAWLTRHLAQSSRDAAKSAEKAAEASLEALELQESAISVQLRTAPTKPQGVGMPITGLSLFTEDSAIIIHSATIVGFSYDRFNEPYVETVYANIRPLWNMEVPRRLHKGEELSFKKPSSEEALGQEFNDDIEFSRLEIYVLRVQYSLGESRPPKPVLVRWSVYDGR